KAHAAIDNDDKAKRFAKEMRMRAAAAKILAKLYRPQEAPASTPADTTALQQWSATIKPVT
ncbi:MAG TPA: hypothetical protein VFG11_05550, partial [Acidobacteriota bacterium]|nr:hypothetical protein [Acidobacteriota bacterium]